MAKARTTSGDKLTSALTRPRRPYIKAEDRPPAIEARIARIEETLAAIQKELSVQLERIAQIQAQLDRLAQRDLDA